MYNERERYGMVFRLPKDELGQWARGRGELPRARGV